MRYKTKQSKTEKNTIVQFSN